MYDVGSLLMRIVAVLGIVLATCSPQLVHACAAPGNSKSESVVLLRGSSLFDVHLPSFVLVQPGKLVGVHDIQRACRAVRSLPDSTLLYRPDSKHCELIGAIDQVRLRDRVQQITNRVALPDPQSQLRERSLVAIAPGPRVTQQLGACGCAPNAPPTAVSFCSMQTRAAGSAIAPIEFLGADVDTPSITAQFAYDDGTQVTMGLPASLDANCTSGTGSVDCIVGGNAPGTAGTFQLNWTVTDGNSTTVASSTIQVLASGDQVFADGFDPAGSCP